MDHQRLQLIKTRLLNHVDDSKDLIHANGLVLRTMEEKAKSEVCMIASLTVQLPRLQLTEPLLLKLVDDSKDWAHANGLVMRTAEEKGKSDVCMIAPLTILPSPFPASLYRQALRVQDATARLYHKIAYDAEFLLRCHEEVVKTDAFTRRLCGLLQTVLHEGLAQRTTVAIQRNDFMCHQDIQTEKFTLKQVEVNNMASGMGALGGKISEMHIRNLRQLGMEEAEIAAAVPLNSALQTVGGALALAWKHFDRPEALALFIVEEVNQNQIDQRHVEYEMTRQGVPSHLIHRRTLAECKSDLSLDNSRNLLLAGVPIAIVYFRSGYSPTQYPTDTEWEARLTIERSTAIKAPWIGLQLANTKKVQQVLAEAGQLERFVEDAEEAAALRETFAGLWSLEDSSPGVEDIIQRATTHPEGYVLKSQLEGGEGNFYGQDVASKLKSLTPQERAAYILMERFRPLVYQCYMLRSGQAVQTVEGVGELGIFGYAFGDDTQTPVTLTGGHLLRTKGKAVDGAGIILGAGALDSPFLYED